VSDVDLVARARQGDPAAFGELVDRHRPAVYRAALAALGSPADAEDAAQDAFLLAYRRLDSFRGDASFKTWLLTITWHQAINRRRSLANIWRRMVTPKTEEEAEAAMIVLGDQPFVASATMDLLIAEYGRAQPCSAVPTYDGRRGNPVIIARSLFGELMELRGDVGFRAIAARHAVLEVPVEDRGILLDVDTPADFVRERELR